MKSFLILLRWKNLLIVAITQYAVAYGVLYPAMQEAGFEPVLSPFYFFLLVLSTVIVAASGNVANDCLDWQVDQVNRPERVVIGRQWSPRQGSWLYLSLVAAGFLPVIALSAKTGHWLLLAIYGQAVFLLWWYSYRLKHLPLLGNLIVAAFCAGVVLIIVYVEQANWKLLANASSGQGLYSSFLVGGYALFAFWSTLFREQIKDLEDMEGDRLHGSRTTPIAWGTDMAKTLATATGVVLSACLLAGAAWLLGSRLLVPAAYLLVLLLLPAAFLSWRVGQARKKEHYHRLSQWVKGMMIAGIILILLII